MAAHFGNRSGRTLNFLGVWTVWIAPGNTGYRSALSVGLPGAAPGRGGLKQGKMLCNGAMLNAQF